MGNTLSGSNKVNQSSISMQKVIESAGKNQRVTIKRLLNMSPSSSDSDSSDGIDSPGSTVSSNNTCHTHANLSFNIECEDYDIIRDLRIPDVNSTIEHIDLMMGHRRFNAVRVGNDLIISLSIPKFIISNNSPLRLDIYPATQKNPDEIMYCYDGYHLNNEQKQQYSLNRIEDEDKHIMYVDGLVC